MIVAVLLAAGESKRFPGNKLLFQVKKSTTIIECIINSILNSNVNHTIAVLGYEENRILPIISKLNNGTISIARNLDYKKGGMSSSIRKGLHTALTQFSTNVNAVIITPADIPFIPSETFNQLIELFYSNKSKIIIPTYKDRKGHPILLSSELFPDILRISEEKRGLKEILNKYSHDILYLLTDHPEILRDVDTYEDLQKLDYNPLKL